MLPHGPGSAAPKPPSRAAIARGVAVEAAVNVALPYAIYRALDPAVGDVRALLASSLPPIAWSVAEFLRRRIVDAISLVVLAGIALSLLAFAGGGSVRFLQLRENLVTGLIGLVFVGSVVVGRPAVAAFARAGSARQSPEKLAEFDALQRRPGVRRSFVVITLVWGLGLIAQTAVACALVFALPIATYLLVGPLVGNVGLGALALWTWWYVRRRRAAASAARPAAQNQRL